MQKYKVFLNEKEIDFALPGEITLPKGSVARPCFTAVSEVGAWLDSFDSDGLEGTVVEHADPAACFRFFRSALLEVDAAGGIVKRDGKLLCIRRNGKWDLPKGKIDKGEDARQAALREVAEECGIAGHRIVKKLPSTFHIYRSPYKETQGEWIFKETLWFEMEYDGADDGKPETGEGISEVHWFLPGELDLVLQNTYANLEPLIQSYLC